MSKANNDIKRAKKFEKICRQKQVLNNQSKKVFKKLSVIDRGLTLCKVDIKIPLWIIFVVVFILGGLSFL